VTATLSLATKWNQWNTHYTAHHTGTAYSGSATSEMDVLTSWFFYRKRSGEVEWTLIAQRHGVDVFGYADFTVADDGADYVLRLIVADTDGSYEDEDTFTYTWSAPNREYYIDTVAGNDANTGLTTGQALATYDKAADLAEAWWTGTQTVRFNIKDGSNLSQTNAMWNGGIRDAGGPSYVAKDGRIMLARYGSGAKPIVTLSNNLVAFADVAAFDATNHIALDIRGISFVSNSTANFSNQIIQQAPEGNAAKVLQGMSHVVMDCDADGIAGFLLTTNGSTVLTEQQCLDGGRDCLAMVRNATVNIRDYVVYTSGQYHLYETNDFNDLEDGGHGSWRAYGLRVTVVHNNTVRTAAGDGWRPLTSNGSTLFFTEWLAVTDCVAYDSLYVLHATHADGGGNDIRRYKHLKFVGYYGAPDGSGGFNVGGDREKVLVTASWFRNCVVFFEDSNDTGHGANNDQVRDVRVECCSWYDTGANRSIGIVWPTTDTTSYSITCYGNALASACTGTNSFCNGTEGIADIAASNIRLSDYNVVLDLAGGLTRWWRKFVGGNGTALSTWQANTVTATTPRDVNSSTTGSSPNYTANGTAASNDADFHTTAGSTFRAAGPSTLPWEVRVDYDQNDRGSGSARDVGGTQNGASAFDDPNPPAAGDEPEPETWRNTGFNNLGLNLPVI
jgi:hypothetical protein